MSAVWRALLALGAAVLVAGCSSSAASDGAVPLDELHGSSTSTAGTEAAAPDPTADRGTADSGPAGTDPVVAAVADVLGGQAAISRPVGDDGSRPEVRDDRVFILGDSIVESAGPDYYDTIRQQLVPLGWRPTIDAQRGRTTPEGLRVLQQRRRDVHDVAVVLLGHNDAVDPTAYRARIDAIVDELAGRPARPPAHQLRVRAGAGSHERPAPGGRRAARQRRARRLERGRRRPPPGPSVPTGST